MLKDFNVVVNYQPSVRCSTTQHNTVVTSWMSQWIAGVGESEGTEESRLIPTDSSRSCTEGEGEGEAPAVLSYAPPPLLSEAPHCVLCWYVETNGPHTQAVMRFDA